ncbi:MAG: type II/IV secretion system ATPase subunit [Nitrososphaerales archaeon]
MEILKVLSIYMGLGIILFITLSYIALIGPTIHSIYSYFLLIILIAYLTISSFIIIRRTHKVMVKKQVKPTLETLKKEAEITSAFQAIYTINPPYAYSAIAIENGMPKYVVMEPTLTEKNKKDIERIRQLLYEELDVNFEAIKTDGEAENYLREKIIELIKRHRLGIKGEELKKINYYLIRDFVHYGKIDVLMRDPLIEDISCNGPNIPVYVWHTLYESLPTNIVYDPKELEDFIMKLAYKAGRHVSIASPIVDAGLPDGNRVNITYGKEVTKRGSTFTIRKFRTDPFTISDLINFNTLSDELAAFFWYVIEHKACVLIVGGTASGKTTTLNALSMFIKPESKIVTIEDTPELNLPHTNWIQSITRVGFGVGGKEAELGLFDLLKAAIRQRPDYIIVGEVRGEEAYTLFQAMATGHGGMGSLHAESVKAAIERLTTRPMNIPPEIIPIMNIIAVEARVRLKGGVHRRIIEVAEPYIERASGKLLVNNVFSWDPKSDEFKYSGKSITIQSICERIGIKLEDALEEIERRKVYLRWLVKEGIRNYKQVGNAIKEYYANPKAAYEKAKLMLMV